MGRWGLIPTWAKEWESKGSTFNAKSETASTLATWRTPLKKWRAAVPVTSYFEWRSSDPAKKQRYEIFDEKNDELILLAGLFSPWRNNAVAEDDPQAWRLSFTILTQAAPSPEDESPHLAALGSLHNRLPVPLARGMVDEWLSPAEQDGAGLLEAANAQAFSVAEAWRLRPAKIVQIDGRPVAELEDNPIA